MDNQRFELMDIITLLTIKPRKIMGFEYDLFKIIHYAVILLHEIEQREGNKKF